MIHFVRLPALGLEPVPDPLARGQAMALRITPAPPSLTPDADTELLPAGADVVLRAARPVAAPWVSATHADGWRVRVRVGVTRGGRVGSADGFAGWGPLPVPGLDLAAVSLGDRLRLEFAESPPLEAGRLVCRLADGDVLFTGEADARSDRPRVFHVDLHRWRDGFGPDAGGVVQVRGATGWFDVAGLVGPGITAPVEPASEPEPEWLKRLNDLAAAVQAGDADAARPHIGCCLVSQSDGPESAAAADLLPLAAVSGILVLGLVAKFPTAINRLTPLVARPDLPEAGRLAARWEIRGRSGAWSLEDVESVRNRLPPGPESGAVLAECWYRYARSADGPADGCWRSVLEKATDFLESPTGRAGPERSDAVLLAELARLVLAENGPAYPATGLTPAVGEWIAAVRGVGQFLKGVHRPVPAARPVPPALTGPAPPVLLTADVALVRLAARLAAADARAGDDWALVRALPPGVFWGLPLIRARFCRYSGDAVTAEEYRHAFQAARESERYELLKLIAQERS